MDKNYIMIKELLKNEKFVKKLENIVEELDRIKKLKNEVDVSFVIPMIFLSLETFRTTKTAFPKNFFKNKK